MERTTDPPTPEQLVAEILDLTVGNGERLAAQVGVSYASLYAWSRGRRRPSRTNALALVREASRRSRRLAELADLLGSLPISQRGALVGPRPEAAPPELEPREGPAPPPG